MLLLQPDNRGLQQQRIPQYKHHPQPRQSHGVLATRFPDFRSPAPAGQKLRRLCSHSAAFITAPGRCMPSFAHRHLKLTLLPPGMGGICLDVIKFRRFQPVREASRFRISCATRLLDWATPVMTMVPSVIFTFYGEMYAFGQTARQLLQNNPAARSAALQCPDCLHALEQFAAHFQLIDLLRANLNPAGNVAPIKSLRSSAARPGCR